MFAMKNLVAVCTYYLGLFLASSAAATPADLARSSSCVSLVAEIETERFNRHAV